MKKVMLFVLVTALVASSISLAVVTDIVVSADTDIRTAAPDYAKANRTEHFIVNASTTNAAKAYLKFELPADFQSATDAELTLTRAVTGAWSFEYWLYALKDNAVGNDWPELSPGANAGNPYTTGMTWNNAPGNNPADAGFTSDVTPLLASSCCGKPEI